MYTNGIMHLIVPISIIILLNNPLLFLLHNKRISFIINIEKYMENLYYRKNSLIGKPLGKDGGIVALTLCS